MPGVLVQPSRRVGNVVRVRNCRPTVWIDGVRVPDAELDEVTSLEDVAAVEIYKSLAGLPQQFIDRQQSMWGDRHLVSPQVARARSRVRIRVWR